MSFHRTEIQNKLSELIDACAQAERSSELSQEFQRKIGRCKRDLVIKRVAIAAVWAFNIGVLAGIFVLSAYYFPIPTEPLFASTFVVGVLIALASLEIWTAGVTSSNYRDLTNPALIAGKAMAYILFGPVVLLKKQFDWTDYANPVTTNKVSKTLQSGEIDKVYEDLGKHSGNLVRYGFLSREHGESFRTLMEEYKPFKMQHDYLAKELEGVDPMPERLAAKKEEMGVQKAQFQERWAALQRRISPRLPFPCVTLPELNSQTQKIKRMATKHLSTS